MNRKKLFVTGVEVKNEQYKGSSCKIKYSVWLANPDLMLEFKESRSIPICVRGCLTDHLIPKLCFIWSEICRLRGLPFVTRVGVGREIFQKIAKVLIPRQKFWKVHTPSPQKKIKRTNSYLPRDFLKMSVSPLPMATWKLP